MGCTFIFLERRKQDEMNKGRLHLPDTLLYADRGIGHDYAAKQAEQEAEQYKKNLEWKQIKHKTIAQSKEQGGSIPFKEIKQYNSSPAGGHPDGA